MIYLGISQDRYDSGVTLTDGEQVMYSANEERLTRRKTQGGFPALTLQAAFDCTGVALNDVDRICVAGLMTPPLPMRAFPKLHHLLFEGDRKEKVGITDWIVDFAQNQTSIAHTSSDSVMRRFCRRLLAPAVRRTLPKPLRSKPICFVEHHQAHASAAWGLSGFDEALCITGDGMGDGLSMTVSRCEPQGVQRLWTASSRDSLGILFEIITESFGFIPCRHEGKVTGPFGSVGGHGHRIVV